MFLKSRITVSKSGIAISELFQFYLTFKGQLKHFHRPIKINSTFRNKFEIAIQDFEIACVLFIKKAKDFTPIKLLGYFSKVKG